VKTCRAISRGAGASASEDARRAPHASTTLLEETSGAIYVEYIMVTIMVSIGGSAAVVALGLPLLALYRYVNMMVLLPIP
jgi:hypothetical protein